MTHRYVRRRLRILDDTVRLRDIVASLPPNAERRFVPTLVVVHWISKNDGDVPDDFAKEVSWMSARFSNEAHFWAAPEAPGQGDVQEYTRTQRPEDLRWTRPSIL